ncbi:MAG: DUF3048 domain-containing protein [Anaerolineae bacterium]|nr:DUF3048 domain-containing protein [Anaerolineae bacterium]
MKIRVLLTLLLVLMSGCVVPLERRPPGTVIPNDLTTETPGTTLENPALFDLPSGVNPLTGLPADLAALDLPPLLVKISNAPPLVRPQAGLASADIVYEHYVEGGLTRFSAVYYGQTPERVGSIRSARLIDYELAPMYRAWLVFSGASTGVEDRLNTSDFRERLFKGVLFGLPHFWRDESIEVPHNLFANLSALRTLTQPGRPALRGLTFSGEAPLGSSEAVTTLDIRYRATRVRWDYDAASGLYRRSADGLGHYDANTMQQVTAANVIVLYAEHQLSDIVESQFQDSVSYGFEIRLWFEGDAVLFRDGRRYVARWVRPTREDMIGLRTLDGAPLDLKPGNTWIQVVRLPEQQNPAEEWVKWQ